MRPVIVHTAGFAYSGKSTVARRIARLLDCSVLTTSDYVKAAMKQRKAAMDRDTLQNSNTFFEDPKWLSSLLIAAIDKEMAVRRKAGKQEVVVAVGPREGHIVEAFEEYLQKHQGERYGIWVWASFLERIARAHKRDNIRMSVEQLLKLEASDLELGVGNVERMCCASVDTSDTPVATSIILERVLHRLGLLNTEPPAIYSTPSSRCGVSLYYTQDKCRTVRVGIAPRFKWLKIQKQWERFVSVPLTIRAIDRLIQALINARATMSQWKKEG